MFLVCTAYNKEPFSSALPFLFAFFRTVKFLFSNLPPLTYNNNYDESCSVAFHIFSFFSINQNTLPFYTTKHQKTKNHTHKLKIGTFNGWGQNRAYIHLSYMYNTAVKKKEIGYNKQMNFHNTNSYA